MDIQAEKIKLIRLIIETDSPDVINQIKLIFEDEESDFYDDLPDHVKEGIEQGLIDIEAGRVYDHEDVMQEFKAKYGIID